ncbi:MAG TPA: DUF4232 domain-containing protein [Solirubrobacteraceae bacterium]|nr:DUF4232 domain-containing protein [Solirubrobacteraceae bacterium]
MRRRLTVRTAAAAALCAVGLAACGGSRSAADRTGGHPGGSVTTVTRTITQPVGTQTQTQTQTATDTGPQTDTTATKTSTTPGAVGTPCTAADLTPSYLGSNGATGTIVLGFAVKNTGSTPCHTYGWPGVAFLSSTGAQLPTHATRTSGDVVGSTPANVLTLAPGQTASFRMVTSDMATGGGTCPTAAALQIIAPDDTATMKVPVPSIAACGKGTVSPLLPGTSAFAGQGGGQSGIGAGGAGTTTANGGSGLSGSTSSA